MAQIDLLMKQKLEHLLEMRGGYVLDFSNASFADFVHDSVGFDPYDEHQGSKAQILRQLWKELPDEHFAQLSLAMLNQRQLSLDLGHRHEPEDADKRLLHEVTCQLQEVLQGTAMPEADEVGFLARDFGELHLNDMLVPLGFQDVISDRLREIQTCQAHGAYLAVVILCGSTLEGMLNQVAITHPQLFNQASAAPMTRERRVRAFREWTLQDLLQVSRELGILGEDVVKYANAVREFRNYIHPQQQVAENFRPRQITGQMAQQVLRAAMSDIERLGRGT